jgi:hypothetical protein
LKVCELRVVCDVLATLWTYIDAVQVKGVQSSRVRRIDQGEGVLRSDTAEIQIHDLDVFEVWGVDESVPVFGGFSLVGDAEGEFGEWACGRPFF